MTEQKALRILSEFFAAVEHCGCILTELETSPEIYQVIKDSSEFKDGRLWTAQVTTSEKPSLEICSIKRIYNPFQKK
jgi:hypothetical protein